MSQILHPIHLCESVQSFPSQVRVQGSCRRAEMQIWWWPQSAVSGIGVQVIPAKPLYIAFLISELSANSVTNNTVIFSMITYLSSQGARIQKRNLLFLFTQRTLFYQLSWLYESLIFSNRSLLIGFFSFRQLCMLVKMFICKRRLCFQAFFTLAVTKKWLVLG